jgi:O-antigen/teichoic acid export membrane protein
MLDSAVVSVLLLLITFVTGVFIARLLGPVGRGQYGAVQLWGQFGTIVIGFSVFEGLVVRLRKRGGDPNHALSLIIVISLALSALAFLIVLTAQWMDIRLVPGLAPGLVSVYVVSLIALGLTSNAFVSIETSKMNFVVMNRERLLSAGTFLVAVSVLYMLGIDEITVLLMFFVMSFLPSLALRVLRFRNRLFDKIDLALAKETISLGLRLHIAAGALAVSQMADRLIIVAIWPPDLAGYYFVALTAATAAMSIVNQAVALTLLPNLAGLTLAERARKVEQLIRLSLLSATAVAVPLFAAAPYIIPLVFGPAFMESVSYLRYLLLATLLAPVWTIVVIASRASESARPGVEMALASAGAYGIVYAFVGYSAPTHLFVAIALSYCCSIAVGLRHLDPGGSRRLFTGLIPGPRDLGVLISTASKYLRKAGKL